MPWRKCGLERFPFGPTRAPPLLNVHAHLHAGLASDQRGCPPGCFSQATCSRSGRVSTPLFGGLSFPLPAELAIEAMVQIHAGIVVGLRFIVANEAAEELASFVRDALTCAQ